MDLKSNAEAAKPQSHEYAIVRCVPSSGVEYVRATLLSDRTSSDDPRSLSDSRWIFRYINTTASD